MNYYNENDAKAAAWLRQLIAADLIPKGEVDERSIEEVSPSDLGGFAQCHFFAGIGGWSYALQLADWPASREVWTGSCPCQPLSCAGQRKGHADERHLWPTFYALIDKRKPPVVFGEQVASRDGREWLAGVRADLEGSRYAVGAADLCAACVGSPHRRQRIYWVADAEHDGRRSDEQRRRQERREIDGRSGHAVADLQDAGHKGRVRRRQNSEGQDFEGHLGCGGAVGELGDTESGGRGIERDASLARSGRHVEFSNWSRFEIVQCRDGKARRFEPESFPLADGISGRVALLRGYGNAIVPQVAAKFIEAFLKL